MFLWRRVAPQSPEEGLKPTATPGYTRNFRDLNRMVSEGKSFSGYERNPLFVNLAGKGFSEVGALLGVDFDDDSRAVALTDWDRDGDLDMWVTNRTAPRVRLLRNNQASTNTSVAVRLVGNGTTTNRDAIGARLVLEQSSQAKHKQLRTVHAGSGFLAQSSAWTHFGLGKSSDEVDLTVSWPGGGSETFSGLKAGGRYTITQDQGLAEIGNSEVADSAQTTAPISATPAMSGFWVANRVPFPKLTYADESGAVRATTDLVGKPVLVNLWATWCVPCVKELGDFAKRADALKSLGATVLALNVDGLSVEGSATSADKPETILKRVGYGLPYGIARQESLEKIEVLIEFLTSRRAPLSIPTSFLVDAEGNVASVYLEPVPWDHLAGDLALLTAPSEKQLARLSPRPGRWFADPRQADPAAYLGDYATLFATNGFPEESQRLYNSLKPKDGVRSAQEYYNLAKAAAQQGQKDQAREHYQAALRLEPEYGQALTGLGALFLMDKRYDEAQPLFEKALKIDPNHATALINLAMIDQARGDKDSALKRLTDVVTRNPDYAEAHLNLGSLLASMKRTDEAIVHLTKAVALNPKREVAQLNLAGAYMETKQWAKADESYREALRLSPRMAYAHYGLGSSLARQERHADAVTCFRNAIALGAKNAQTYTLLGASLLAQGDKQGAVDAWKAALTLDPQHAGAKAALRESGILTE